MHILLVCNFPQFKRNLFLNLQEMYLCFCISGWICVHENFDSYIDQISDVINMKIYYWNICEQYACI